MNGKVGCSWHQLELRGRQNSTKSKQVFGSTSIHTFVVERENDGNSLLRFMKVVVPEYKELIPPPNLSAGFRPLPCRINARIQNTEPIGAAAPRHFRQNTETTMALNAFSDLEAIAEMGAGADDVESQLSEAVVARPPSKMTGRCSPNSGNAFSSMAQQNSSSAAFDHRIRPNEQQNAGGVNSEALHFAQMSMEQQQRQRFGMSVVYRQQTKQQQSITPICGINPTTASRMMMDSQPAGLRHSNTDVFNFVPDHSPFEEKPNFGISSAPYQSPTGAVRRRGRGRRAGNFGDRQPSTSSSVEHEGTPESPSEFGTIRKSRGANSGQRRPRKPRKPANMSFDQLDGIPQSPFQTSEAHAAIGHPPLSATSSHYISAQIEEDFRSKMMSVYEMGICESSTDDEEMDPPPPPKELIAVHCQSENPSVEPKMAPEMDDRAAAADSIVESEENNAKKCGTKCGASSSHPGGGDRSVDLGIESSQNAQLLQDIKLISSTLSSASSSPSFSQFSEQSDYRMPNPTIGKTETETNQRQRTAESSMKLGSLNDNKADETSGKKKQESELDRHKPAKDVQTQSLQLDTSAQNKFSCQERTSKEFHAKTDPAVAKRPALVLKIKKDGATSSTASAKHSSSSSPSSSSSSNAAPPSLPTGPSPHQQHQQQQQLNEPVARLSSSAAPPSKYKQQRQQTKRPAGKDEAVSAAAAAPTKKKPRKNVAEAEVRSASPTALQQHRTATTLSSAGSAVASKWVKEGTAAAKSGGNLTLKKESTVPNVMSQIAVPVPNLKHFKIPKVIENPDPPPSSSNTSHFASSKGGPAEYHQQNSQISGGGPASEKGSRSKFGPFKSSDHFDQRRSGGGTKQTAKSIGHPSAHYNEKFVGNSGGGGNSFQPNSAYNRQRTSKQQQQQQQQQLYGGGRHGGNSEPSRKQHGNAVRPALPSSAAGHRFTVQFQQHIRDSVSSHGHRPPPPPPSLQHFAAAQHQFSSVGWQSVQTTSADLLHQQQSHNYFPQQQQQRVDWLAHGNDQQAEQRQQMLNSSARPNQTRTTDRQSGNCREEDRTDNSPSAGSGLQIVDDE